MSEEQQQFASTALQQSEQVLSLLNRVLDLAKVASGKLQPECVEFEVRQWLEEGVAPHREATSTKGLACEYGGCSLCQLQEHNRSVSCIEYNGRGTAESSIFWGNFAAHLTL